MADIDDSDQENSDTIVRTKPQDFVVNCSDEEKSLCQVADEHLSLHQHSVQLYTPENYLELPGRRAETYEVVSIPCSEHGDQTFYEEEPIATVKLKPRRVTAHTPNNSETDTTSSDTEARPRPKNTGPITASSDSSDSGSGYGGDIDSDLEASRRVDHHRKPVDHQYNCRTIISTISHKKFCNRITRWQYHGPIDLPKIILPQCGVKLTNCQLHCRGLDNDIYERNATFTAVAKLSQNSIACSSSHECFVELGIEVYEGRVDPAKDVKVLGTAKERRKLTKQEREQRAMHIAVHRVVKLDVIIFNETCPKVITFQVQASVQTIRNELD